MKIWLLYIIDSALQSGAYAIAAYSTEGKALKAEGRIKPLLDNLPGDYDMVVDSLTVDDDLNWLRVMTCLFDEEERPGALQQNDMRFPLGHWDGLGMPD